MIKIFQAPGRKSPVSDDEAFAWLERVMGIEPFPAPRCDPQRPALLALPPIRGSIFLQSLALFSTLFRHAVWTVFKPASSVWPLRCLG
jgi:hypothetical protein